LLVELYAKSVFEFIRVEGSVKFMKHRPIKEGGVKLAKRVKGEAQAINVWKSVP
jgi:hypothetical protein